MKTILIIEDDPVATHIYLRLLTRHGYRVETAPDGATGLERLQDLRPEGVLLDLMLPHVSGIEFLKQVRAREEFKHLTIVAFTNAFVPQMIEQARAAGATRVLDKSNLTQWMVIEAFREELERVADAPLAAVSYAAPVPTLDPQE